MIEPLTDALKIASFCFYTAARLFGSLIGRLRAGEGDFREFVIC
jgi:hypothetical protein